VLRWICEPEGLHPGDGCFAASASTRAFLKRIRDRYPVADESIQFGLVTLEDIGPAKAGKGYLLKLPAGEDRWKWLDLQVREFARLLDAWAAPGADTAGHGRQALTFLAALLLGLHLPPEEGYSGAGPVPLPFDLRLSFDQIEGNAEFAWSDSATRERVATGVVYWNKSKHLSWELETDHGKKTIETSDQCSAIGAALDGWLDRFPPDWARFFVRWKKPQPGSAEPRWEQEPPFDRDVSPVAWIEESLVVMAEALRLRASPLGRMMEQMDFESQAAAERQALRLERKEQKRHEELARRQAQIAARLAERDRRDEEARRSLTAKVSTSNPPSPRKDAPASPAAHPSALSRPDTGPAPARNPVPPVPIIVKPPSLIFQDTAFALNNLNGYALRERAALWWVSNQTDDLLCLPNCRIERLDYQLRAALRVLGPLRGRALLSDEVGLGKTIEAGLVIKELLTRGMIKRFLVLTLPSLVDQWAEELGDKFGLATVSTNQADARADASSFWRNHPAIVASLHTLKQPAHLAVAREVHWDLLIVDEAHYLRNRASQAWQAVNVLPRQYLLLLTATPVQNSLEELYNLVTLLQPGQLSSPRDFRNRFFDPKRPREPRDPAELRRLLGQVMIRNTRANAGIELPPRRAETVLFTPGEAESAFWQRWEEEFRGCLAQLSASQASLWGRLLLQAAGSSPAAWRSALEKFPDQIAAQNWRGQAPLEGSWRRKCDLLAPLTRGAGGAVIFSQFLETQSALGEFLRGAGVETFVINGATPAPERQPITDEFRRRGGALLLTHSGTEGRNLQFSHCLVNFDLPWNPMEIEQRIGRLHRLGQQQPVQICNFVQAGTLQEYLLQILQEKLNLFELVVGETGLVLGERYSGDEFEEELFRRWRENAGRVSEAFAGLGDELAVARTQYGEVKQLDETLFAKDFESL
jgi:SNF2 family DNA or RNA helicase